MHIGMDANPVLTDRATLLARSSGPRLPSPSHPPCHWYTKVVLRRCSAHRTIGIVPWKQGASTSFHATGHRQTPGSGAGSPDRCFRVLLGLPRDARNKMIFAVVGPLENQPPSPFISKHYSGARRLRYRRSFGPGLHIHPFPVLKSEDWVDSGAAVRRTAPIV
jgi:hypothetical protein